jgi:hypothetical protein
LRSKKPPRATESVVFTVDEFCARNGLSLALYGKLRKAGLNPREMRIGPNWKRITQQAEIDWQKQREAPQPDLELQATERAVKAAEAAVKSAEHISKKMKEPERAMKDRPVSRRKPPRQPEQPRQPKPPRQSDEE